MDRTLVACVLVLAVLYVASVGPYWNISPDSATYVGSARSLVAGRGFGDSPFHPPLTALVFAPAVAVQPNGYGVLNALNTLLVLAGVAAAFVMIQRQAGRTVALVCAALALAYRQTYHESTQLLSEPTYYLISFLALLLLNEDPTPGSDCRTRYRQGLAAMLVVAAAMTRTIGLTLALAVLVVEGLAFVRRSRPPRLLLVAGALVALVAVGVWEAYAAHHGASTKFEMFFLRDAWSAGSGFQTPGELLIRMLRNAGRIVDAGTVLLNKSSTGVGFLDSLLGIGGVLLVAVGLAKSLRQRADVTTVYTILFVGVVLAHVLEGGYHPYRHLVPVMPLVALFAARAAQDVVSRAPRRIPPRLPQLAAAAYVAGFISVGALSAAQGLRAEHTSPFGDYPVKCASNFDVQRVAFRLRDISNPGDRYATGQPDMIDVFTERVGRAIPADARQSGDSLLAWVRGEQVRYVLLDHRIGGSPDDLLALLRANAGVFRPVLFLAGASLFAVAAVDASTAPGPAGRQAVDEAARGRFALQLFSGRSRPGCFQYLTGGCGESCFLPDEVVATTHILGLTDETLACSIE